MQLRHVSVACDGYGRSEAWHIEIEGGLLAWR
jgi:hypothetical protein